MHPIPRHLVPATLVLFLLPCAPLTAQVVRGGDLVTTNYSSPSAVFRVDHTGAVTTLLSGAPLNGPAGITVADNRDVIVANFNGSSLVRIDALTGAATTFATGLGGPLRVCPMQDGDFAATSNTSRSILRITPAGAVSTIAGGAPMTRPFGVCSDLNGDLLVADDLAPAVWRVTPQGSVSLIHRGAPLRLPQGVALFPNGDYAVFDGITDSIHRIDRASGLVTTWVPTAALGVNPEGMVTDGSGGFFVCHSGSPGGSGIRYLDAAGAVSNATGPGSWTNLEDVARVPQVIGPRFVGTGPTALFTYDLDSPGSAGDYYSLILSTSVHPGWPFPGGDPRALFLNVDPFFLATIGQNSPPFLANWSNFLDGNGRGTATLDLRAFPAGFLTGLDLFQQGILLTPQLAARGATNVNRLTFQ